MKGHDEKLWWQLCELAALEQNPEKVLAIAREVRRLLEEKEKRLGETKSRDAATA
jgi:hypothetical protein